MATIIIGLVLTLALGVALRGVVKHWRGEGSCCGGGGEIVVPPPKKLQGRIIGKKVIKIDGMTCGNCKIRVEEMLNAIDGAATQVNLHHDEAVIEMTREVSDYEIHRALQGSGYKILSIS